MSHHHLLLNNFANYRQYIEPAVYVTFIGPSERRGKDRRLFDFSGQCFPQNGSLRNSYLISDWSLRGQLKELFLKGASAFTNPREGIFSDHHHTVRIFCDPQNTHFIFDREEMMRLKNVFDTLREQQSKIDPTPEHSYRTAMFLELFAVAENINRLLTFLLEDSQFSRFELLRIPTEFMKTSIRINSQNLNHCFSLAHHYCHVVMSIRFEGDDLIETKKNLEPYLALTLTVKKQILEKVLSTFVFKMLQKGSYSYKYALLLRRMKTENMFDQQDCSMILDLAQNSKTLADNYMTRKTITRLTALCEIVQEREKDFYLRFDYNRYRSQETCMDSISELTRLSTGGAFKLNECFLAHEYQLL